MKTFSTIFTITASLWFVQSTALAKSKDLVQQKIEYVTKSDQTLEEMKKEATDLEARIGFAPHKNHRKIEYHIERLKNEVKDAEKILGDLRIAPENEWSSYKPRLDVILKDMAKDKKEAEALQK